MSAPRATPPASLGTARSAPTATELGRDVLERWPAARPFVFVGAACTIAGGLVAAVARPTGFELGSWLAAYLVLVGGVAQLALGVGQAWLADRPVATGTVRAQLGAWNLGAAATILGSLLAVPALTAVGALATVVALVLFLRGVGRSSRGPRWAVTLYRLVTAVVLAGAPVGLLLAWLRHG